MLFFHSDFGPNLHLPKIPKNCQSQRALWTFEFWLKKHDFLLKRQQFREYLCAKMADKKRCNADLRKTIFKSRRRNSSRVQYSDSFESNLLLKKNEISPTIKYFHAIYFEKRSRIWSFADLKEKNERDWMQGSLQICQIHKLLITNFNLKKNIVP